MKWRAKDIERFLEEKQYVDTIIVPLIPLNWDEGMLATVREGEYVQILGDEIERQLKGRVVLNPAFTYFKEEALEERMKRLETWKNGMINGGGKFVYFVTSDVDWKAYESQLEHLIWLPAVPLEHMDERHRNDFVAETVGSVMKTITGQWIS
ncbi:hypothetical protein JOD43_001618 [Pullulanibacillus pueri]|uniref:DUF2487 family protein n=1 Tax=Pullulanibacillus pueri TaxID=1437324 RepID=A0A8J3EM35_9BACL|nr:YpiF family protein [Pullulanibacillus pueri]MBM7681451.1 hypothetical protein [Pullulanibacillus pueri]GGH78930.1 hypothetical protein GCM10007096_13100 [Pullulanibacillus pueri]